MAGNKRYRMIIMLLFCIFSGINNMFGKIITIKTIFEDEKVIKLIELIQCGNYKETNELIKNGVDINFKGIQGITPIYYVFLKEDYNSFKKLLELGADPNVDPEGVGFYRLIDFSMRYKDDRYFKLLLEYNVDIEYRPKDGDPLLESALYDDIDIKYLKMLLDHGIKPYYSEYSTDNPLLSALIGREYKKVILLLDYYPDYLKDERKIKLYKREATIKEMFIEDLESYTQEVGSQLYKDQLELVKYLKDKFGIEVKLKYPNGK